MKVIMDACREDKLDKITAVVAYIDNIFADNVTGILTLSTIHRRRVGNGSGSSGSTGSTPARPSTRPWIGSASRKRTSATWQPPAQ
jgi:hypothetical protein